MAVPKWLATSTPWASNSRSKHVVFPGAHVRRGQTAVRRFAATTSLPLEYVNYASYEDYKERADQELLREANQGFLDVFPARQSMSRLLARAHRVRWGCSFGPRTAPPKLGSFTI